MHFGVYETGVYWWEKIAVPNSTSAIANESHNQTLYFKYKQFPTTVDFQPLQNADKRLAPFKFRLPETGKASTAFFLFQLPNLKISNPRCQAQEPRICPRGIFRSCLIMLDPVALWTTWSFATRGLYSIVKHDKSNFTGRHYNIGAVNCSVRYEIQI